MLFLCRKTKVVIDTNLWISFLISRDNDLLVLKTVRKTKIVKMSDFLAIFVKKEKFNNTKK